MKTTFLIFIMLLIGFVSYSQQDTQYTQYTYNTTSINPAYAGSRECVSIFGMHRSQWGGLDGAPTTSILSVDAPLRGKVGGGLSFFSDRIGPIEKSSISTDMSYTIETSENYKLSFGIKISLNSFQVNQNKLNPKSLNDQLLQNHKNYFSPNIGTGLFYHSEKMYLGASIPNFFQMYNYNDENLKINESLLNFYVVGGYVLDVSSNLKFKPAFIYKVVSGAPLQLDVSGNFLINEKFVLGASWRWSAAVSAIVGFQISKGIYLGYGYDFETTNLSNYNSGSHELFFRFELFKNNDGIASPRFF